MGCLTTDLAVHGNISQRVNVLTVYTHFKMKVLAGRITGRPYRCNLLTSLDLARYSGRVVQTMSIECAAATIGRFFGAVGEISIINKRSP